MNWGNKLLISFAVFASMMSYLVYRAMNVNFELVEKEYYKKELRYQQVIDASNNSKLLSAAPVFEQTDKGLYLTLPQELKNKTITGDIWFYCAYDSKNDKKLPLQVNADGIQFFEKGSLAPAHYTVKINFESAGDRYYSEKNISIQ